MSKLYIDVTQLVQWQGKMTGIPRVMNELSSRFKLRDEVCLIVWDASLQAYSEVSRVSSPQASAYSITGSSPGARFVSKILPARTKNALKKFKGLITGSQRHSLKSRNGSRDLSIKSGDKLMILWGEWADMAFIDEILQLAGGGVKIIQISYDMLPIVTPQYSGHATHSLTDYAKSIYPVCSLILAISKHTKKDVIKWLSSEGLHVPRVEVFRLGDDFAISKPKKPDHRLFDLKQEFILMVGTIEARKNHALIYYVYKLAKSRGIELPKIVIAGRRGWMTENIYELMTTDPEVNENFIFLHDATDDELSWLYANCMFTIYPSLYEGWGLPVAESLYRGVPCIASNTSSMPEISSKGVIYFNPVSSDECLKSITLLLNKTKLSKLKEDAERYTPTQWDSTFKSVDDYVKGIR